MNYTDTNGGVVMSFTGQGSTPTCWDGPVQFSGGYMAMYRVCR